jgi:glutathione S-transferase
VHAVGSGKNADLETHVLSWFSALKQFDVLEKTLADGREFLVNKEFSVADISVGYACNFLKMLQASGRSCIHREHCCRHTCWLNSAAECPPLQWTPLSDGMVKEPFLFPWRRRDGSEEPLVWVSGMGTPGCRLPRCRRISSLCSQCSCMHVQLDDEARFPNVRKYTERVTSRPAFQKAFSS